MPGLIDLLRTKTNQGSGGAGLRAAFRHFDKDKSGRVDVPELQVCLERCWQRRHAWMQLLTPPPLFLVADTGGSGLVQHLRASRGQFVLKHSLAQTKRTRFESRGCLLFAKHRESRGGLLLANPRENRSKRHPDGCSHDSDGCNLDLCNLDLDSAGRQQVEEMIKIFDPDGSGSIDFFEFVNKVLPTDFDAEAKGAVMFGYAPNQVQEIQQTATRCAERVTVASCL